MAEGSIHIQISGLEGAISGISTLVGDSGSGLTGAAGLMASSPLGDLGQLQGLLQGQLSGALRFDPGSLGGISGIFEELQGALRLSPGDALTGFQARLDTAGQALGGDLGGRLAQALETVRGLSGSVPADRLDVVKPLVDRILAVFDSLGGDEVETIQAWVVGLQAQLEQALPILEEARNSPDPGALAVSIFEQTLGSILDALGFSRLRLFVDLLQDFPARVINAEITGSTSGAFGAAAGLYGNVQAGADFDVFRGQVDAALSGLLTARAGARRVVAILRQFTSAEMLQPGGIEAFLRGALDRALAVQVRDAQQIDDPFKALFDRIDAAIDRIDLSVVRTEILGSFAQIRQAIQQADLGSLAAALDGQISTLENAVGDVREGADDLLSRLQAACAELTEKPRQLLAPVGEFQGDGSFRFHFERELTETLGAARRALGGDPADPDAASVARTLADLQARIDGFLGQLSDLLAPVEEAADGAVDGAVEGIQGFAGFLNDLDVPGKLLLLQEKVQEIVDALLPIDFAVIVDPVVQALDENTEKLGKIDPASLNEMLRAALSAALEVVISIDFSVEISAPLGEQLAAVKAIPAQAIEQLQARYREALGRLDDLDPLRLLDALLAAFDAIEGALARVDLAGLLAPLDQVHRQAISEPLARLAPSRLVAPLSASYRQLTSGLDSVRGADLIAPADAALGQLKQAVASFNLTGPIDELSGAVARMQETLRGVRPSQVLEPLSADFGRLEAELDRFKPSVLFAPVAELATPLLELLEGVQQTTVTALFELFEAPLRVLDALQPEQVLERLRQGIDQILALLRAADLPGAYARLRARHFDLNGAVTAGGSEARLSLALSLDPQAHLGEVMEEYTALVAALERIRAGLAPGPLLAGLVELYGELRERLLGLLPPFARAALDVDTFKRVMRLADPTRFLQELDPRFEALKAKLLPIRPQDLAAELDAAYDEVLAVVDRLEIGEALERVKAAFARLQGTVTDLRVDFLAADVDRALADVRAVVAALDPARAAAVLDGIYAEVQALVESTLPSRLLAGLGEPLERIQGILAALDPRNRLQQPLEEAWDAVLAALAGVDFTVVLKPLVDKLDDLEAELMVSLGLAESAFDRLLGAAQGAVGGGGGISASVSVSVGGGF